MKYECCHVDTCLPDYWSGHHLPHVQIPVYKGMSLKAIKQVLKDELRWGYVMGNSEEARLLSADFIKPEEVAKANMLTRKAYAAVNRLAPGKKGQRRFFLDLEENDGECCDSVYAYFVFVEV